MYSLPGILPVLALLGALSAPGLPPAVQSADLVSQARVTPWPELVDRDARVSFTSRTEVNAGQVVADPDVDPVDRSVALFALGSTGSARLKPALDDWVRRGELIEQRAALLALGELGEAAVDVLSDAASSPRREIAEAALLGLLRTGHPSGPSLAEQMIGDPSSGMRESAGELLDFATQPGISTYSETAGLWLVLRWRAGQRFGLIDGGSYSALVLQEVLGDDNFLEDVVLLATAEQGLLGSKDHLLQILLEGRSEAALQAAVRVMPQEIDRMVQTGLWTPANGLEWRVLLDTIWEHQLAVDTPNLLLEALDRDPLRRQAAACLIQASKDQDEVARNGDVLGPSMGLLQGIDVGGKLWTIEFMNRWQSIEAFEILERLREDDSAEVRWSAHAVLLARGNPDSTEAFATLFDSGSSERRYAIDALIRHVSSARCAEVLRDLLRADELAGDRRLEVAAALVLAARAQGLDQLSTEVRRRSDLPSDLAGSVVKALGYRGRSEDLQYLRDSFPASGSDAYNRAAAVELIRLHDPVVLPVLRAAIWRGPWDRSLLACGLLVDLGGLRALWDELQRAPDEAKSTDLRRVGFAFGKWGGLPEVDRLARRQRSGGHDPVLQGAMLGALSARTQ